MVQVLCWSCNRRPIDVMDAWCQQCFEDSLCLICKQKNKPDAITKICRDCDLLFIQSKFYGLKNGMRVFIESFRDG